MTKTLARPADEIEKILNTYGDMLFCKFTSKNGCQHVDSLFCEGEALYYKAPPEFLSPIY